MGSKRGLGAGKDSIFKKTVQSSTKEKPSSTIVPKKTDMHWETFTSMIVPEHRRVINEVAFMQEKQKRQVLYEMIQFYIDNKK